MDNTATVDKVQCGLGGAGGPVQQQPPVLLGPAGQGLQQDSPQAHRAWYQEARP